MQATAKTVSFAAPGGDQDIKGDVEIYAGTGRMGPRYKAQGLPMVSSRHGPRYLGGVLLWWLAAPLSENVLLPSPQPARHMREAVTHEDKEIADRHLGRCKAWFEEKLPGTDFSNK